ncbi:hypothetical protein DPQ33_15040 [Oceanidesulfovibrio indonesiensis]|uniref:Uncharacterized protein n=1 Tax=Oceanidesulfovibrio indonesiensis TaxID=54767 RepID=A0A7M3MC62_9BACT|nr:hypothetical protein DPQ33_15040 [Oceanidesulfovibrio indonesiensis]
MRSVDVEESFRFAAVFIRRAVRIGCSMGVVSDGFSMRVRRSMLIKQCAVFDAPCGVNLMFVRLRLNDDVPQQQKDEREEEQFLPEVCAPPLQL